MILANSITAAQNQSTQTQDPIYMEVGKAQEAIDLIISDVEINQNIPKDSPKFMSALNDKIKRIAHDDKLTAKEYIDYITDPANENYIFDAWKNIHRDKSKTARAARKNFEIDKKSFPNWFEGKIPSDKSIARYVPELGAWRPVAQRVR